MGFWIGEVFIQTPYWTNGETEASKETGPAPNHTVGPTKAKGRLETQPVHSESYFPSHHVGSSRHFAQSKQSLKVSNYS